LTIKKNIYNGSGARRSDGVRGRMGLRKGKGRGKEEGRKSEGGKIFFISRRGTLNF